MVFCFAYNLQLRHIALKQREKLFFLKKKKNAFELCRSDLSRGKCHFIGIFFFFLSSSCCLRKDGFSFLSLVLDEKGAQEH